MIEDPSDELGYDILVPDTDEEPDAGFAPGPSDAGEEEEEDSEEVGGRGLMISTGWLHHGGSKILVMDTQWGATGRLQETRCMSAVRKESVVPDVAKQRRS